MFNPNNPTINFARISPTEFEALSVYRLSKPNYYLLHMSIFTLAVGLIVGFVWLFLHKKLWRQQQLHFKIW